MYPIEELEDEVVSSSQQTPNMTKPAAVMEISSSISSSRKPEQQLRPSSASPSSSSSSVMGKVERPAIKIYGTLMVATSIIFSAYQVDITFTAIILPSDTHPCGNG